MPTIGELVPELAALKVPDLPPTTTINGIEVDLRSESMHDTLCADCTTPLLVHVWPKGVDIEVLTAKPRIAVCEPCGKVRAAGKRGILVHHDHNGRTQPLPKETELDLTNLSNAMLAQKAIEAREQMVAEKAAALPKKREKAMKKKAKREAKDKALLEQAREARKGRVLPGFEVAGKEVPALDLSEVTDLGEVISASLRSPYNKALFAAGEPILDRETATYAMLAEIHVRFGATAKHRMVVGLDADAKAKVEAYAKATNTTHDEARKLLASANLI